MAMNAVLNTTELLEQILASLPHQSLFKAERVCKKWQALICDSKTIARARCLAPVAFVPRGKLADRLGSPVYPSGSNIVVHPATRPLKDRPIGYSSYKSHDVDLSHVFQKRDIITLPYNFHELRPHEITRLRGLDSKAYLTEPPVTTVHLTVRSLRRACRHDPVKDVRTVSRSEGVRMGDLQAMDAEWARPHSGIPATLRLMGVEFLEGY